jgi:hypothetical protein
MFRGANDIRCYCRSMYLLELITAIMSSKEIEEEGKWGNILFLQREHKNGGDF